MIKIIKVDKARDQVEFLDTESGETCIASGDFIDLVLGSTPPIPLVGYPYTGPIKGTAMEIPTGKMFEAYKCLRQ